MTGVAGGGYYKHEGSGGNYVCLPLNPDYEQAVATGGQAWMYGTEYERLGNCLVI